eukprot:TRINITY_DN35418_c0_g2_i1.p1 TRINITY_DN35418_c0_g2~~TRINITY_DN35418_c0_g2_i1.p1  ORF type:complete len:372 (+),score=42.85 TRINITY_DN35418_c0_g2_i1:88-1203(+)
MASSEARVRVISRHLVESKFNESLPLSGSSLFQSVVSSDADAQTVGVVGAPYGWGQSLPGVELAPAAFRAGGLETAIRDLNWTFNDYGDINPADTMLSESLPGSTPEDEYYPEGQVKNSTMVGAALRAIHDRVVSVAANNKVVLTIGGDHSVTAGTISGIMQCRPDAAVIHVSAYSDCNTPSTSRSGNYHGMWLAHLLGWFKKRVKGFEWFDDFLKSKGPLPEARVALLALRNVDSEERTLLRESGVHIFTMADIDSDGIGVVMERVLDRIDPMKRRPLHLSFDIGSCDPSIAPGTGTKTRGGLSLREAHFICEKIAQTKRLGSMDIVEVNPAIDRPVEERFHGDDPLIKASETVSRGIELIASALGKTTV